VYTAAAAAVPAKILKQQCCLKNKNKRASYVSVCLYQGWKKPRFLGL